MTRWFLVYLAALLTIGVLDGLWLGWVARDFYQAEMAALAADKIKLVPALAFYLLYPVGLLALGLMPEPPDLKTAVLRCAGLGLLAYATYDLTNLATLRSWSWRLAATDVAWGTFISTCAGGAAFWVLDKSR